MEKNMLENGDECPECGAEVTVIVGWVGELRCKLTECTECDYMDVDER